MRSSLKLMCSPLSVQQVLHYKHWNKIGHDVPNYSIGHCKTEALVTCEPSTYLNYKR